MPEVFARVLTGLCAELAPTAVAVGPGDERMEAVVVALLGEGNVRIDRVAGPGDVAADVTLVVARLGDAAPWTSVSHAVTLYASENAVALDGHSVADTAALLHDYADARVKALECRLHEQAAELATLRARLAPVAGRGASTLTTDRVADKREAAAAERFTSGYDPAALLAALGWEDADGAAVAGPLPIDRRPPGEPEVKVTIAAGDSARGLLQTCWSVLGRASAAVALEITLEEPSPADVRLAAAAVATLGPGIRVIEGGNTSADDSEGGASAMRIAAGDIVAGGWPAQPDPPGSVAFVLPGAPPGGSGGSHSVVQEVLGLNELGIGATLVVPSTARPRIEATYPEVIPALVDYADDAALSGWLASSEVIVATEYTSVAGVVAATRQTGALPAYYVQDYEAFFAPDGSERGDAAVLSYRADPALRLFAKTHWLANLVTALHGVPVELITPSVDRRLFHREDRSPAGTGEAVRVCAMVRPRTPRRRPAATVRLLSALRAQLGDAIEVVTFGCAPEELATLTCGTPPAWEHRGILRRQYVADVLRDSDIFVDLSVYQAFGRTGCEAMASGAVPVLPAAGGVAHYATDGVDAILVDGGDADRSFAAVAELVRDRERLRALGEAGAGAVAAFSIENAAQSWATALGAALAAR